jgi:hypothetical protein
MIACPECSAKNNNRNVYCGMCSVRLKPVPTRLREDILFVTRKEQRKLLTRLSGITLIADEVKRDHFGCSRRSWFFWIHGN